MNLETIQRKISNRVRSAYLKHLGATVRKLHTPKMPSNGPILIHLGCGEINDPRYINVDARPMPHVHFVTHDINLSEFQDRTVDLIYACHVVEHLSHLLLVDMFSNWLAKLKPGGVLRISVPDFDQIVAIYLDQKRSIESIKLPLMGGQEYPTNFHYAVFNKEHLTELLLKSGFSKVVSWTPEKASYHKFDDWSGRQYQLGEKSYDISLNLEGHR